jgi:hypothetical protein
VGPQFRLSEGNAPETPVERMAILKRTLEMKIRFTKAELDALNKKAKKTQMSREGYCRAVLNGATVKEAPPADIPMLLRAMRQAGYNLDQTLKRFNTTNVPDMPQFRKGLEEIRAATKMVSDAYTSDYQ